MRTIIDKVKRATLIRMQIISFRNSEKTGISTRSTDLSNLGIVKPKAVLTMMMGGFRKQVSRDSSIVAS